MALKPRYRNVPGSNDINALFGDAPKTPIPWDRAGRRKDREDFDQPRVNAVLMHPDRHEIVSVDPRELHATQPEITRGGVQYYSGDEYRKTGRTFADHEQAANRVPIVYNREGKDILLSGHHRAAAALLSGDQFRAFHIEGPWGPER